MIAKGTMAPEFFLKDQEGKGHRLSDYRGRKVALYFYPKDNTAGCTAQGCNIRDNFALLKSKGIVVFGVSKDSVGSHKNFAAKYHFNFPILSDEKGEVIGKYGVWKEKSMWGKTFMGVQRATFLIDESGTVVNVIEKADTANHSKQILKGFFLQNSQ